MPSVCYQLRSKQGAAAMEEVYPVARQGFHKVGPGKPVISRVKTPLILGYPRKVVSKWQMVGKWVITHLLFFLLTSWDIQVGLK